MCRGRKKICVMHICAEDKGTVLFLPGLLDASPCDSERFPSGSGFVTIPLYERMTVLAHCTIKLTKHCRQNNVYLQFGLSLNCVPLKCALKWRPTDLICFWQHALQGEMREISITLTCSHEVHFLVHLLTHADVSLQSISYP